MTKEDILDSFSSLTLFEVRDYLRESFEIHNLWEDHEVVEFVREYDLLPSGSSPTSGNVLIWHNKAR